MELWDPVVIALAAELDNPDAFKHKKTQELDQIFSDKNGKRLIEAFIAAKTPYDLSLFIKDLLSDQQIEQCKKRLYAAYMLSRGTAYKSMEKDSRLSPTVAAHISKKLRNKEGGYNLILAKLYPEKFAYYP